MKLEKYIEGLFTTRGDDEQLATIICDNIRAESGQVNTIQYKLQPHPTILKTWYLQLWFTTEHRDIITLQCQNTDNKLKIIGGQKSQLGIPYSLSTATINDVLLYFVARDLRNQNGNDVRWCEPFLLLHNDPTPARWLKEGLIYTWWVWKYRVQTPSLAQKEYITYKLHWKTAIGYKSSLCEFSNVRLPHQFLTNTTLNGKTARIARFLKTANFDFSPWTHYAYFIYQNVGYTPGYFTGGTPVINVFLVNSPLILPKQWAIDHFTTSLIKCDETECNNYILGGQVESTHCCPHCQQSRYPNLEVLSYETNPLTIIKVKLPQPNNKAQFPKLTTPFLIGCELEYNCDPTKSNATRLSLLKNLANFVIFKRDSSLDTGGFEIVTIPALLAEHYSRFVPVFNPFSSHLKISQRTGMHIHLDRKVISPLVLGRMIDFLNLADNRLFVESIGERPLNEYCSANELYSWGRALDDNSMNRHTVLNLQKRVTAEFRFFKSPVNYLSFAKNIEFIWMLWNFYQTGWINYPPQKSRNSKIFLDYVKQKNLSREPARNSSPYLYEFLKTKGMI